jgi:hypothetical protein
MEAFVNWAVASALQVNKNSYSLLYVIDDVPLGLILSTQLNEVFEIHLAGIHEDFQRQGWYMEVRKNVGPILSNKRISRW